MHQKSSFAGFLLWKVYIGADMGVNRLGVLPLIGLTLLIFASSSPVSSETGHDNTRYVGVNLLEFAADDREQWDEDQSPPDIAFRICVQTSVEEHCENIAFEENRWTLEPQADLMITSLVDWSETGDELRLTLACFDVNDGVNDVCDLLDGPGQFLESEWVTIERLQMQSLILSGDGNGVADGESLNARTEWSLALTELPPSEPDDEEDWIWGCCCLGILIAIGYFDDDEKKEKETEVVYVQSPTNDEHLRLLNNQLEQQNAMIIALTQQIQNQQATTTMGMTSLQDELDELRQKKLELTGQLEAAENKQTVVHNITYNIQDSVVARDLSTQESMDERDVDDN